MGTSESSASGLCFMLAPHPQSPCYPGPASSSPQPFTKCHPHDHCISPGWLHPRATQSHSCPFWAEFSLRVESACSCQQSSSKENASPSASLLHSYEAGSSEQVVEGGVDRSPLEMSGPGEPPLRVFQGCT